MKVLLIGLLSLGFVACGSEDEIKQPDPTKIVESLFCSGFTPNNDYISYEYRTFNTGDIWIAGSVNEINKSVFFSASQKGATSRTISIISSDYVTFLLSPGGLSTSLGFIGTWGSEDCSLLHF